MVTGEVRGLEVCRVVDQPTTGYFDEAGIGGGEPISAMGSARRAAAIGNGVMVEVGVGGPDREAFRIIHGDLPTVDALAEVVATVAGHRTAGAPPHPLNRLVPRSGCCDRGSRRTPALVGLRRRRTGRAATAAAGTERGGPVRGVGGRRRRATVPRRVFRRRRRRPDPVRGGRAGDHRPIAVVVVLPSRDLVPITRDLAALLRTPVTLATVD